MTDVNEQFINDLEQCLNVADQLSEVESEDTKMYVSKQLQDLQKFLQKKQADAEERLQEDIAKEEKEIATLKERISQAAQSDGTSEFDIAYGDIGVLWETLYEDTWKLAFDAYISETNDKVTTILDNLIAILKASYKHCKDKAKLSRDAILFQVFYPGDDAKDNKSLPVSRKEEVYQKLEKGCKQCQIQSAPFCMPSILQAMMADVKADKTVAKYFKSAPKLLSQYLENYLEKCVEFSWIACFEEPEIQLTTTPKKECKHISHKFKDLDRTTHRSRQNGAHVEWPAVVQGDAIRIPWKLYTLSQPRPEPKHLQAEQSKDYRVIEDEGQSGGNELDDDEDTHALSPTPTCSDPLSGLATANNSANTDSTAADKSTNKQSTPEGKPSTHKEKESNMTQDGRSQRSELKLGTNKFTEGSNLNGATKQPTEGSKPKGGMKPTGRNRYTR